MKDINKLLPKLPKDSYATLSNFPLSLAEIKQTARMFRYDSKWHILFNEKDFITIDGKSILKQSAERFT